MQHWVKMVCYSNVSPFCPINKQLKVLLSEGEFVSAVQIAIAATDRFSKSTEVWTLSLQTLVDLESAEAEHLFQEGLRHVNPKVSVLQNLTNNDSSNNTIFK